VFLELNLQKWKEISLDPYEQYLERDPENTDPNFELTDEEKERMRVLQEELKEEKEGKREFPSKMMILSNLMADDRLSDIEEEDDVQTLWSKPNQEGGNKEE